MELINVMKMQLNSALGNLEILGAMVDNEEDEKGLSEKERQAIYKALVDLKSEIDGVKRYTIMSERTRTEIEEVQDRENTGEALSMEKTKEGRIREALEKYNGNRKLAAQELGISERSLYRHLPEEYRKG